MIIIKELKVIKKYEEIYVNYDHYDNLIYNNKDIVFDKIGGVTCKLNANEHLAFVGLSIYGKIGYDNLVISAIDLFKMLSHTLYVKNKDRRIVTYILEGLKGLDAKGIIIFKNTNSKLQINTDLIIDISKIRTSVRTNKKFYVLHHQEVSRIMLVNQENDLSIDRAKLLLLFSIIIDTLSYHEKETNPSSVFRKNPMLITPDITEDFDGVYCWFSHEQLASMVQTSPKTIREYLEILEDLKLIYRYRFKAYYDEKRRKVRSNTNWIGRYQHKELIKRLAEIKSNQIEYAKRSMNKRVV